MTRRQAQRGVPLYNHDESTALGGARRAKSVIETKRVHGEAHQPERQLKQHTTVSNRGRNPSDKRG